MVCFLGGFIGFWLSNINFYSFNKSLKFYFFFYYFSSMWFLPLLSTIGISFFPLKLSFFIFKSSDQGWFEFFGIQKIFNYFIFISKINQFIQFNNLKIYLTLFVFWILVLFILVILLYLNSL
jgi:NADH-ubiquinone oxidoreductase chain 5